MASEDGCEDEGGAGGEPSAGVVPWYVYVLVCRSGRLYVGVTPDLAARMRKHVTGTGAKFTRGDPPVSFLGATRCVSRGEALRMEISVKRLRAVQKRVLAQQWAEEKSIDDLAQVVAALTGAG